MHYEFLVEDRSGKDVLEGLIPKIIGSQHTFKVHAYRGIGRLPLGLRSSEHPQHRALLSQLPRLLRGYRKTFAGYPSGYRAALVVVCDLDQECRQTLRQQMLRVALSCGSLTDVLFCIAEEEIEAWLLGDKQAICHRYTRAKVAVLDGYVQDSICGTWETLADAIYQGGAKALRSKQYFEVGTAKGIWAREITPHMNVDKNASPSFQYLRDKLRMIGS